MSDPKLDIQQPLIQQSNSNYYQQDYNNQPYYYPPLQEITHPQPISEPYDKEDEPIEPQWHQVEIRGPKGRIRREFKIVPPQNDYYNVYAPSNYDTIFGFNIDPALCKCSMQRTYPSHGDGFKLLPIDPSHRILQVCTERELKKYIKQCNKISYQQPSRLDNYSLLYVCILIGILLLWMVLLGVILSYAQDNSFLIWFLICLWFGGLTGIFIYFVAILKKKQSGFMNQRIVDLQEHILKTRGPLMDKGVKARLGPYAAYIMFETR